MSDETAERRDQIAQLQLWIEAAREWNDALKQIPGRIDDQLAQCQQIADDEQAVAAMVDLLFLCNRLEHMIKVWVGESDEEE